LTTPFTATGAAAAQAAAAPIAVLGAGSWGTALAVQFARTGHPTLLWGRDTGELTAMARERRNRRYLPEAELPPSLDIEASLERAVASPGDKLIVVPSHAFRAVLTQVAPLLAVDARVAWATKGFELATGLLPHQVAREVLGPDRPVAVLSGPTFAHEVGAGLPTAIAVASPDADFASDLAHSLTCGISFRAYTQPDIVGVEVGGATKNVLAIGAGISDGMGYGANTRIALITRGLAEMVRLGEALGAKRDTFMGLAGLGDLVLTCTDDKSRNRRFGLALAQGRPVSETLAQIGQVVEGVQASRAVRAVAVAHGVDMPICEAIYRVLHEGLAVEAAVQALMSREITAE